MIPVSTSMPWSEESLLAKARLYVEKMEGHTPTDWEYGLWSTFALELIIRAAVSHISPVLLANPKDWRNTAFALGRSATSKKFTPRSIGTTEALTQLGELADLTPEVVGLCVQHLERRNTELHSGEIIFGRIGSSEWLPNFYICAHALLAIMGKDLGDLFSHAAEARSMIDAFQDKTAKAVEQEIKSHRHVWSLKTEPERDKAIAQAAGWATRQSGHRVDCPACGSPALLQGSPNGTVSTNINAAGDEVVQKQSMLPSSFECIACGLRISGLSKLAVCGLGDAFTGTHVYTPAEFFELYTEDDLDEARASATPEWEPDWNE